MAATCFKISLQPSMYIKKEEFKNSFKNIWKLEIFYISLQKIKKK